MKLQDILRATEDRAEWRRIIHSAVNPRIKEDWRQDETHASQFFRIRLYSISLSDANKQSFIMQILHYF